MHLINVIENTELTAYVLKLLNNEKIYNILQFMQLDNVRLANITNLSIKEILKLKKLLAEKCEIVCVDGLKRYRNLENLIFIIPTGIEKFDGLIGGGLFIGSLIEFCGLSGSGKTQICNTIAVNCAQNLDFKTLYVDTKHDFSGKRIAEMLKFRNLKESEIGKIMQKILIERVRNVEEFIKMLKELLIQAPKIENFKILIVDSMPSIWFLYHGEKTKEGMYLLVEATNLMKRLANEHKILVIVVNIITRWMNFEIEDYSSVHCDTTNAGSISMYKKPALGKYWETVPATRFLIEDPSVDENIEWQKQNSIKKNCFAEKTDAKTSTEIRTSKERIIKILKSNFYSTLKNCTVNLTNRGIE